MSFCTRQFNSSATHTTSSDGHGDQKLLPAWSARLVGLSCASTPMMNTTTTPSSANTRGSGNHCSLQFASFRPKRTRRPSVAAVWVFSKAVLVSRVRNSQMNWLGCRPGGAAGAREHENVSLRVDGHAGGLAQIHILGELQQIG